MNSVLVSQAMPRRWSQWWHSGGPWRLTAGVLALLVLLPIAVIFTGWVQIDSEVWRHLADTVLTGLVRNTLVLLLGVGVGVTVIGVSLAWITTAYEFRGRAALEWLLMLPLAVPPYVLAFVFIGMFDFSGPVQAFLNGWLGPNYWFPEVRSEGGVILVMSLALYPYVYMLARAAFIAQGRSVIEAARIHGLTPRQAFLKVALPMARPAVVAGMSLALMETLADFGAVSIFNYDTFTTAIYKAWFGLFNLPAAGQLASLLLLFVFVALIGEGRLRGKARYHGDARGQRHLYRARLHGWRKALVVGWPLLVLTFAFILPLWQLLTWTWQVVADDLDERYWDLLLHTLTLGGFAALFTVSSALLIAYTRRHFGHPLVRFNVRLATLGYALPGSVLAVGIMTAFAWVDDRVADAYEAGFGVLPDWALMGSVFALVFAYGVRFLAVAYGAVDSAFERIRPSIMEAARGLGASHGEVLRRVYLPILRPGLLTGTLLVFVEVMKEMPATLLLRPFGWDTLAVRIYELTSEGEWERAALPAVALVLAGLGPVILLVRRSATTH
ncbi:MAG: iron ABC transporter permease [Gammaproteobacteria bacterium]|nr:iron ABC transporter permease [Gammaproteobacteria bacterium]MCP5137829.1 iron ABC transporter permease [Gammaproteobacteria bacterium]